MIEHRFAKLAAAATFCLLVIGGTVNPTGSSLACPEPTLVCNGQLFPPMTGGVLYEHGHRLAAMTVGFLQIILTVLLLRRRRDLRLLAWTTLAMVLIQGGLGAEANTLLLGLALGVGFRVGICKRDANLGGGQARRGGQDALAAEVLCTHTLGHHPAVDRLMKIGQVH